MKTFRTKHTIMAPRAGLGLLSLQLAAAPVASAWSLTINLGLGVNLAAEAGTDATNALPSRRMVATCSLRPNLAERAR